MSTLAGQVHAGRHLFPLCYEDVHLALMCKFVTRPMPESLLIRSAINGSASPPQGQNLVTLDPSGVHRLVACADPDAVDKFPTMSTTVTPDDFYDLLHALLELDPMRRMTAKQALSHPFLIALQHPPEEPPTPAPAASPRQPVSARGGSSDHGGGGGGGGRDSVNNNARVDPARLRAMVEQDDVAQAHAEQVSALLYEVRRLQGLMEASVPRAQYEEALALVDNRDREIAQLRQSIEGFKGGAVPLPPTAAGAGGHRDGWPSSPSNARGGGSGGGGGGEAPVYEAADGVSNACHRRLRALLLDLSLAAKEGSISQVSPLTLNPKL